MKAANATFEKINSELPARHRGKIVAIDTDTGQYFIGDSELDAYRKASKKLPGKKFMFKRIGFNATHFVGAA